MRSCSISIIKSLKTRSRTVQQKQHQRNHKEITFYLPHRSVIRENAGSTKDQIVHDGSVKASNSKISLNVRSQAGLLLESKIWDILFRKRFKPISLSSDIKMAFLQSQIRKSGRDLSQFHWILNKDHLLTQVLHFISPILGLFQSFFLLNGAIKEQLKPKKDRFHGHTKQIEETKKTFMSMILLLVNAQQRKYLSLKRCLTQRFKTQGCNITNEIPKELNLKK